MCWLGAVHCDRYLTVLSSACPRAGSARFLEVLDGRRRWRPVARLSSAPCSTIGVSRERKYDGRRTSVFAAGDFVVYPTHGVGQGHWLSRPRRSPATPAGLHRDPVRQGPHDPARAGGEGEGFRPAQALQPQGDGSALADAEGPLARQAHDVEPPRPGIRGQDQFGRSRARSPRWCATCTATPTSPTSPTASGRSIRRRSTGWCASSPPSRGSTRWPRRSGSSRC